VDLPKESMDHGLVAPFLLPFLLSINYGSQKHNTKNLEVQWKRKSIKIKTVSKNIHLEILKSLVDNPNPIL
jgi:hypothetical protein